MAAVQTAMVGRLPYTELRDAIFAHPTISEGPESSNSLWSANESPSLQIPPSLDPVALGYTQCQQLRGGGGQKCTRPQRDLDRLARQGRCSSATVSRCESILALRF
jgi:hypothetical protein